MLSREQVISRLVTGIQHINMSGSTYEIRQPTIEIKIQANQFHDEIVSEYRFSNFVTSEEIFAMLVKNGMVSLDFDKNIEAIDKRIDDIKVSLYKNMLREEHQKKIRKELNLVNKKKQDLLGIRHMFDNNTLEGFATSMAKQFILIHSIYKDGKKLWANTDDADAMFLDKIAFKMIEDYVPFEEIRAIARTDPWRPMWSLSKLDLFAYKSSMFYTDEQKALISFSKMYDSIYEHGECPPDKVIEDDDMLDGWMVLQRRNNDKHKMDHYLEEIGMKSKDGGDKPGKKGKFGGVREEFVFTKTKEEAEAIYNINDENTMLDMQQRAAKIKQQGVVKDIEFSDVRREVMLHGKK